MHPNSMASNSQIKKSARFAGTHWKKNLIKWKEIICLKDFSWFKLKIYLKWITFVQFKQNIVGENKYLFKLNKIFFKWKKLMHWYMVKDIIFLIQGRNLFHLNKFLFVSKILWLNQTNLLIIIINFFQNTLIRINSGWKSGLDQSGVELKT